jgi:hypothetical protein
MLKLQMNECPNPKCQKPLEKLIIVDNTSKNSKFNFACPHCEFILDPTKTQLFKKEQKLIQQKTETKKIQPKKESPPECPKHLGYLKNGSKNSIILTECLTCPKMTECMF